MKDGHKAEPPQKPAARLPKSHCGKGENGVSFFASRKGPPDYEKGAKVYNLITDAFCGSGKNLPLNEKEKLLKRAHKKLESSRQAAKKGR